jgi:hypothetical protein
LAQVRIQGKRTARNENVLDAGVSDIQTPYTLP